MIKQIPVTAEHIKQGRGADALSCPVALALRDAGCIWPAVGPGNSSVIIGEAGCVLDHCVLDHDDELTDWIFRYDAEEPVPPIMLELRIAEGEALGVLEVASA